MDTNPSPSGVRLPSAIGRYRVDARLGRGSMGVVYRAFDPEANRGVAIKVMNADVEADEDTTERFYREAYSAGQLVHKNLVAVYDTGVDAAGRPFIVMELLEGVTLGEWLQRFGVRLEEKLDLVRQLCDGLHAAHLRGVYHRDIKPDNLLVNGAGELKVVDFGVARVASSNLTTVGLIVGTPDYMSPEQALGDTVDARSDIFSAGAVFYFALTGRKPFAGTDIHTVLHRVTSADPLPIRDSEAPAAVAAIVQRALAKLPDERYTTAAEMSADLLRVGQELADRSLRLTAESDRVLETLHDISQQRDVYCRELEAQPVAQSVTDFRSEAPTRMIGTLARMLRVPPSHDIFGAIQRAADVEALRQALTSELTTLGRAALDMRGGERAVAKGNLPEAIAIFESVLAAVPTSARAHHRLTQSRRRSAELRVAHERADALVAEGRRAANTRDWTTALALADQALAASSGHATAVALRDEVTTARDAETEERRRRADQMRQRAEQLAQRGAFDEALQAIEQVRALTPGAPALAELTARVQAARLDAERADAAQRRALEIVASATASFDRGNHEAAIAELSAAVTREPDSATLAAALARVRSEADRLARAAKTAADAARAVAAARAALDADDPDTALTLARQALALMPSDPDARQVETLAVVRLRERAAAEQRRAAARAATARARELLSSGRFDAARAASREAALQTPDDPALTELLSDIATAEFEAAERSRLAQEARSRAAAAAPVLGMANAAEASGDLLRAQWLAENALALDDACLEAKALISRVEASLSVQPALAEETVRLNATGRALDPDETVTLRPAVSTWRHFGRTLIQRLRSQLRGRASGRQVSGPH